MMTVQRFQKFLPFALGQRTNYRTVATLMLMVLLVMALPALSGAQTCLPDGDVDQKRKCDRPGCPAGLSASLELGPTGCVPVDHRGCCPPTYHARRQRLPRWMPCAFSRMHLVCRPAWTTSRLSSILARISPWTRAASSCLWAVAPTQTARLTVTSGPRQADPLYPSRSPIRHCPPSLPPKSMRPLR